MKRESFADKIFIVINYILLVFISIIVLYPLIFVVIASISDPLLVNSGQVWLLPKGLTFDGYSRVFQSGNILLGYKNTILYTFIGTIISIAITFTCAYPLTVKELPYRKGIFLFFTFTMFFSGGIIPTFLLIRSLNMYNTVWAMILPGAVSVMNIIIARTFIETNIPSTIIEAAAIDGCNEYQIFAKIILPLSKPILVVLALFYGVQHWNAYFNALIYLSDEKLYPLQVFLREILIQTQLDSQMLMSGSNMEAFAQQSKIAESVKYGVIVVSTLPLLVIFPFLQKFFEKGVMLGAVKG